MNHEVRFTDAGIEFEAYPFVGASVYPRGLVPPERAFGRGRW